MQDYYRCDPVPQVEVVLDGFAQGFAGGAEGVEPGDSPAQGGRVTIDNTSSATLNTRLLWELNVNGFNRRFWAPISVGAGTSLTLQYTYLQPVNAATFSACLMTGTIGIVDSPDPVVDLRPPPPSDTLAGGGK